MYNDIVEFVQQCSTCQLCLPRPPVAPVHSWETPPKPWYRLHIDVAGPFLGKMYLILVDAYTKWLEVSVLNSITSDKAIEALQSIFSVHGLPSVIVTDNGLSFVSEEFKAFTKSNGVQHVTASPYHPSTNGLVERAVQSFKLEMRKLQGGSLQSCITRFLFRYSITPSPIGVSPAESLMGRKLKSCLDLIYPDATKKLEHKYWQQQQESCSTKVHSFDVGDEVL